MTQDIYRCIVFLSLFGLVLIGSSSLAQTSSPVHGEESTGTVENREAQGVKGAEEIRAMPGSKTYHLSTCPDYGEMNVKAMVRFKTEEEARRAGYKKAENCP